MGLDTQRTHTDRPDRDDAADECRKSIERARKLLPIATGRLSEVYRDNKHPSGLWVAAAKMEKEGMLVTSEIPGGVEKSVLYSIQSKKMPDKMHTFGERVEYPVFMRNEVLDAHKGNVYKDGGYRLWFYNAQGLVSAEIVRGPDGEFISEATHEYLDNGLKKRFFKKGLQRRPKRRSTTSLGGKYLQLRQIQRLGVLSLGVLDSIAMMGLLLIQRPRLVQTVRKCEK